MLLTLNDGNEVSFRFRSYTKFIIILIYQQYYIRPDECLSYKQYCKEINATVLFMIQILWTPLANSIFTLIHELKVHFNHYQEQFIISRSLVDITIPNTLYFQSEAYIIINIINTLQNILFVVFVFKTA